MSSGTLDISGGTVNICDELDVADGTVTVSGGTLNVGAYTGASNGDAVDRFEMDAGTLNLTGGTLNIMGQNSNSSYDALDLSWWSHCKSNFFKYVKYYRWRWFF